MYRTLLFSLLLVCASCATVPDGGTELRVLSYNIKHGYGMDGEVDITFAFNPADASNAIANNELPDTVRSFVFDGGTMANSHFLAIPFNGNSKAGAMVLADFMMSPEAQARKQDPAVWGDPTVLDVAALDEDDRARFERFDLGIATLPPDQLGPAIPEPHTSWLTMLEAKWARRYGANQ